MDMFISNFTKVAKMVFEHNLFEAAFTIVMALFVCFVAHRVIDVVFHYRRQFGKYKKSEELKKRSRTIAKFVKAGLDVIIWIYAVLNTLSNLGVDVPRLMTGAGLLGAMLGFGAQNTIRDVLAGFFVVFENQYRVGDIIETQAGGRNLVGKVENISLRITQIRDRDGKVHTIRNGASESVTNMSFKYANVNFSVGVAYDTDIDHLEQVVNEVGQKMLEDEELAKKIIEPIHFSRLNGFKESEIEINCIGRVKAGEQYLITGIYRRMLKKAFDENGIEFPFPQVVVHDKTSMAHRISTYAAASKKVHESLRATRAKSKK